MTLAGTHWKGSWARVSVEAEELVIEAVDYSGATGCRSAHDEVELRSTQSLKCVVTCYVHWFYQSDNSSELDYSSEAESRVHVVRVPVVCSPLLLEAH